MPRPKTTGPTEKELAVLQVLWERGPATVREVHEALPKEARAGYTSLQKIMSIMLAKGLVSRDARSHSHVYAAAQPREATQQLLTRDLLERVFGGSAKALLLSALVAKPASHGELEELKRLLDEMEGEAHD